MAALIIFKSSNIYVTIFLVVYRIIVTIIEVMSDANGLRRSPHLAVSGSDPETARLLKDKEFNDDLMDIVFIEQRRGESSRTLEKCLTGRKIKR